MSSGGVGVRRIILLEPPRVTVCVFCEFFVKKCCPLLTTLLSGSPIIQNGKLVGAVTHVLINDPTTGYGIFIENMLTAVNIPMAKTS